MAKESNIIGIPQGYVLDSVERFNLLQYEQASTAYREQLGILIKLVVLFMTVDVVLTGFGIRSKEPIAFLFAAITGITLIITIFAIYRLTIPALCIGVELEDRAQNADGKHPLNNQIVSTMVLQELGPNYLASLQDVASERDTGKREAKLRALSTPIIGPKVRLLCSLLGAVSLLQIYIFAFGVVAERLPFSPIESIADKEANKAVDINQEPAVSSKPNYGVKTQSDIEPAPSAPDESP